MADMDQSAINRIILDAGNEDPTKKVDKLEKEVMLLKGSIKKLIVDIREQMNNAENPFLNIQQLQMAPTAPVIREDPIQFEMPQQPQHDEDEDEADEEPVSKSKKKQGKKGKKKAAEVDEDDDVGEPEESEAATSGLRKREQELLERERELDRAMGKYGSASKGDADPGAVGYSKRDMEVMNEFEEQRRMLDTMRSKTQAGGPATLTGNRKIDPYTINQIMDWTRNMIRKNGSERLSDLLEMYVSTGYLSEETKLIVQRMSKLMAAEPQKPPKRLDIKECVSDLYTLYMILNPGDKELDSRMLNVLLNPEERF